MCYKRLSLTVLVQNLNVNIHAYTHTEQPYMMHTWYKYDPYMSVYGIYVSYMRHILTHIKCHICCQCHICCHISPYMAIYSIYMSYIDAHKMSYMLPMSSPIYSLYKLRICSIYAVYMLHVCCMYATYMPHI